MISIRVVAYLLFLAPPLVAQPKFEVAVLTRTDHCGGSRSINPEFVTLMGVPLKPVLMEAFKVKSDQIAGPSWLETDCFSISGKVPEGGSRDQISAMLQALLIERLKLATHMEYRERPGYALIVDKGGPKVKQDDPKANFMGSNAGLMFYGAPGHGALKGVMTMATLAANLSTKGYGPVQDRTGLAGSYDVDLSWDAASNVEGTGGNTTSPVGGGSVGVPEPKGSLFTALRESLGLKLERQQLQVQFLVIDHIERTPTAN
jgi:uncharacterized protein (TIGR03435 family)